MSEDQILSSLNTQSQDYAASAARAALGAIPFAGSLLAEVAGTIIPNQRIDRVVEFAKALEVKFAALDRDFIRVKLTDENFTDLLEESIRQAARSVSDERRQYLASVIANGLSPEAVEFSESKYLLKLLSEINDTEVLILRSHLPTEREDWLEFQQKHGATITCERAYPGSSQRVHDRETLYESYAGHLVSLGLLNCRYKTPATRWPRAHDWTYELEVVGYKITRLGEILLRHIGLVDETQDE